MTSLPSDSDATSVFAELHPAVQRWIWDQGWHELRPAQAEAARPIMAGNRDLIISAATASGKTEAALLPICSAIAARPATTPGVEVLYLAPLKALINDQFSRLQTLAERIEMPVHRWHGDVGASHKTELLRTPTGALLITPESLEALYVLRGTQIPLLFGALRYVIVDELHSFIGTERGAQLQSLLHRLELALRRTVPRIALSATLGDMDSAAEFLRPGAGQQVLQVIDDNDSQALKLQLRGYQVSETKHATSPSDSPSADKESADSSSGLSVKHAIAADLFKALRGSDNLIFANTRTQVEVYSDLLTTLSTAARVPNEFFAHHGSLSKELREHVERELKDHNQPINAVCTSTLEMGIDIGAVHSIAQIGTPATVASMRQRLGRSGRRGDAAVLRVYVSEPEIVKSTPPPDTLRAELVQSIAMVNLLLARWYEPSHQGALHLSTLIQQLLSLVAQHGGVLALDAYSALCGSGPFKNITKHQFAQLLKHLGKIEILSQSVDGTILLGPAGEHIVNHFSFYAAFATPEEWRLVAAGQALGTLPIDFPLSPGVFLIFGGRRWRVQNVDTEHRVVDLAPAPAGRPPRFAGTGATIHDRVRQEMLRVYQATDIPAYADATAAGLLKEARQNFTRCQLDTTQLLASGDSTYLFLWAGDRVVNTATAILAAYGHAPTGEGLAISVANTTPLELAAQLIVMLTGPAPDATDLAATVRNKTAEKYDGLLPETLLDQAFAARSLDVPGAWAALRAVTEPI